MTHCLTGLMLGALLGAGVELDSEPAIGQGATVGMQGKALNLADAFQPEKSQEQKKPSGPKPLKRRVLVFKASWCGTCALLDQEWPALRKKKWRIGTKPSDHFQLIDVDRHPDLMRKYWIGALPTVILMDGARELERHTYLTAIQLADLYRGE